MIGGDGAGWAAYEPTLARRHERSANMLPAPPGNLAQAVAIVNQRVEETREVVSGAGRDAIPALARRHESSAASSATPEPKPDRRHCQSETAAA